MSLTKVTYSMIEGSPANVLDFGAVGDGVTDDTTAIQAAINSGAKNIYLPAGTYKTSATLLVSGSGITIYGDGIAGTILLPNLAVAAGITIGGAASGDSSINTVCRDFTVSRAAGTPPTDCVGILWTNFNYGTEINTRCTRHYYPRKITSNQYPPFITIGYRGYNLESDNAVRAYALIEDVAGVYFSFCEFGRNGGEAYDPLYCIEITSEANDVNFESCSFIPRGPTPSGTSAAIGFVGYTNTSGYITFINGNTENVQKGFFSDAATPLINQLNVTGGRFAATVAAANFNAATELRACTFVGVALNGDFAMTNPVWTRISNCVTNIVTINGDSNSDLVYSDNTNLGVTTFNGTWGELTIIGNTWTGSGPLGTFNGNVIRADAQFINYRNGQFVVTNTGDGTFGGQLKVGNAAGAAQLDVLYSGNSIPTAQIKNTNAAPTTNVSKIQVDAAASSTYMFGVYYANVAVSADPKFAFRGDGNGFLDGSWSSPAADYAEYFEWVDGNPTGEDRRGFSVSLVGNQIKKAESGDVVIGIVSSTPTIVGDAAWGNWNGKYAQDDFGSYVMEDYDAYTWTEIVNGEEIENGCAADNIPKGVIVPDDKQTIVRQRQKLNPSFDASLPYIPREDRKEWSAVGLMGKLRMIKGQITNPNWIKMRDISSSVEEWLVK
jgi:hypothetical protein